MFKNGLTIVVLPQQNRRVWRFRLPGWFFGAIALVMLGLFGTGALGVYHALDLREQMSDYTALKRKHFQQQIELQRVANRVQNFKDEIARLRELDHKLRLITDLEVEQPGAAVYGIGGFSDATTRELPTGEELENMDMLELLNRDLSRLEQATGQQEESFNNLKAFISEKKDIMARSPYRWPVRGFISSTFGPRTDPLTGQSRMHEGIDIVAERGTTVQAPADGIVTFAGKDASLGNMLVLDHGYGIITRYGHNASLLAKEGQRVKRGDAVATIGSSGRSTGPHLHYEVRVNDVAVNPMKMIIE